MKLKVRLFDGPLTVSQQLILIFWSLVLAGVVGLWALGSLSLLTVGFSSALLSIGRLLGLLATFFALTQFMLMGRVAWIERSFGLDRLASYHRLNGYLAITLIVLHPIFIVGSYAAASGENYIAQYLTTLSGHPYAWLALIAQLLFIAVVISSIVIVRRRLKFETWYFVHLMVYLAIVLVPFHQLVSGTSLSRSPVTTGLWLGLYGFVALNLLIWRFGLPVYNFFKFGFTVSRVEAETPTTTSIYIRGRKLQRLKSKAGQFVLVRFLTKRFGPQEHPFSLSMLPTDDELRLTIRAVGDYTTAIRSLKPGARVVLSGPFGRFTRDVAVKKKRLFIAGGIGITPLRSMFEETAENRTDSVLLYSNKTPSDVPLKQELDTIAASKKARLEYIYSDETVQGAEHGFINSELIKKLVPDYKERDIYLCGPPGMMAAIVADLKALGASPEQIHYERFALHGS